MKTMNEIQRCLTSVSKLIESPKYWCQGALARDKADAAVGDPASSEACAWCLVGAVLWAVGFGFTGNRTFKHLLRTLGSESLKNTGPLVAFNDTVTHEEVRALLKRAIETAQ
jgi:hypothetical protein